MCTVNHEPLAEAWQEQRGQLPSLDYAAFSFCLLQTTATSNADHLPSLRSPRAPSRTSRCHGSRTRAPALSSGIKLIDCSPFRFRWRLLSQTVDRVQQDAAAVAHTRGARVRVVHPACQDSRARCQRCARGLAEQRELLLDRSTAVIGSERLPAITRLAKCGSEQELALNVERYLCERRPARCTSHGWPEVAAARLVVVKMPSRTRHDPATTTRAERRAGLHLQRYAGTRTLVRRPIPFLRRGACIAASTPSSHTPLLSMASCWCWADASVNTRPGMFAWKKKAPRRVQRVAVSLSTSA